MKYAKFRFVVWLCLSVILSSAFVITLFVRGFPVNANILDLLPDTDQSPMVKKATMHLSQTLGDQVIFLVANEDQTKAYQSANRFVNLLKKGQSFKEITNIITADTQKAWGSLFYPHRLSLLSKDDYRLLAENKIKQIQTNALAKLYSPIGITSTALLENDPYFLFQNYLSELVRPATNLNLYHDHLMAYYHGKWYSFVTAKLKESGFSLTFQDKVTTEITEAEQAVISQYPNTNILKTGTLFFAKAGAEEAQHDISVIGVGSVIGIILLIFITFRSLSPLLYTLFSAAIGFVSAFMVTYWVFGSVYLFTLVFGASLIGISVDYAFFYYAEWLLGGKNWNVFNGLKRIFPGITLGLINIVVAYLIISLAPFPGLRQLALFAIVGLSMAYLTVVCAFPLMLKAKKKSYTPWLLKLSNLYLALWQKIPLFIIYTIFLVIIVVSIFGISQLKANDDIKALEHMPLSLTKNEQQIKAIIGNRTGMSFIVISGVTKFDVIQREKNIASVINTQFPDVKKPLLAISQYIPTKIRQQNSYHMVEKKLMGQQLINYLISIGINPKKAQIIKKRLSTMPFDPLTVDDWLKSPASDQLDFLWLGKSDHLYASMMLISDQISYKKLANILKVYPYAEVVNQAKDISNVFKTYRERLSFLLGCVLLLLFLLLFARYGIKKAVSYFLVPLASASLGLAVLGLFGVPLTLFNILAMTLVLGIAVDYVLFFAETQASYQSTMLAVMLSAITTVLSFGLLAFSSTPVVHYFGLSVFVGITCAFLLSPVVVAMVKRN
ncbi:MMPL family transporter [Thiotrichales bacterium 19S3-7]|nr:MMPL family transporter [Thiotrichales bacterium 19S3-7]MCF6802185.1 MMPL family transporter [Thiotrichales bacterium 19S3-11]